MNSKFPKALLLSLCLGSALALTACATKGSQAWHSLFDGSSLDGWRSNDETPGVFSIVEDDTLKVQGGRAHLFWVGKAGIPAEFTNFELRMKVKTTPHANSGLFFHTKYQEEGWPKWGLEAQVNSTHKDKRKTGSIYAIQDVLHDAPSVDGEWFDYSIRVVDKTITLSINGTVVNQYVEPDVLDLPEKKQHVHLGRGTFAIQGHDPGSTVFYRDIQVRVLD